MTQQLTTQYTAFAPSAEQRFVEAANSIFLKIKTPYVSAKQRLNKILSRYSSRSAYYSDIVYIQDVKNQVPVNFASKTFSW